jgi:hypothetical protein
VSLGSIGGYKIAAPNCICNIVLWCCMFLLCSVLKKNELPYDRGSKWARSVAGGREQGPNQVGESEGKKTYT